MPSVWSRARCRIELLQSRLRYHVDTSTGALDEMYKGDPGFYFWVGDSAMRAVERGLRAVDSPEPRRVLDFGCGHGRVLRFFRRTWPQAAITACDIDLDGVRFCAQHFGAEAASSAVELGEVQLGRVFDLIWSGSLLTHLAAARWPEALALFDRHLAPGGTVIFSTHGDTSADVLAGDVDTQRRLRLAPHYGLDPEVARAMANRYREEGFAFAPYADDSFGLSVSSEAWVRRAVETAGFTVRRHELAAWGNHQDIVTITRYISGGDA